MPTDLALAAGLGGTCCTFEAQEGEDADPARNATAGEIRRDLQYKPMIRRGDQ